MDANLALLLSWLTPLFIKSLEGGASEAGKLAMDKVRQLIPGLAGKTAAPEVQAEVTRALEKDGTLLRQLEEVRQQFEIQSTGLITGSISARDNAKVVIAQNIHANQFKF